MALRDRFNRILGENEALCRSLAVRLSGLAVAYPASGPATGRLGRDSRRSLASESDLPLGGAPVSSVYRLLNRQRSCCSLQAQARQPHPAISRSTPAAWRSRLANWPMPAPTGRACAHCSSARRVRRLAPHESEPPAEPPLSTWLG